MNVWYSLGEWRADRKKRPPVPFLCVKGRVNNYLSAQGYDLKLASKQWAERRKQAK